MRHGVRSAHVGALRGALRDADAIDAIGGIVGIVGGGGHGAVVACIGGAAGHDRCTVGVGRAQNWDAGEI